MMALSDLCPLITMFKHRLVRTDSFLIYLLSPITSSLLITVCVLMASFQLFGTPIRCQVLDDRSAEFIEEYCWATSTFSTWGPTMSPIYPGVGEMKGQVVYHNYYQYMPVVLLLLAGLCMLPHLIWRFCEGGLMVKLVPTMDKKLAIDILHWEEVRLYSKDLANYFRRNINSLHHHHYGQCNQITEAMCFLNIISIIFILQWFLKTFLQYLPHLVLHHLVSPLPVPPEERLFPLLTKCSILNTGPSGSSQTQDALCLLSVNLINQKVFLLIWLWMAFLLITSFLLVLNTFLTGLLPILRRRVLIKQAGGRLPNHIVYSLVDKLSYGDWLVVTRTVSHFTPDVVRSVLAEVEEGLEWSRT